MDAHARVIAAVVGLSLAAAVALAARLTPDPRGWGTHEQLGLAPCWFRQAAGRPCPACGMTTAWAYAVRGNALAAVDASVGGAVLFAICVVAAAWCTASAASGRWLLARPRPRIVWWIGAAWLGVTLVDWLRRGALG